MWTRLINLSLVLLAFSLSGCASIGSLKEEPKTAGRLKFMTSSYSATLQAVRDAIKENELNLESEYAIDPKTTAFLVTNSASAWSWGDNIRVAVENTEANKTAVWIMSKRKHQMDARASEFSDSLFSAIEYKLQTAKKPKQ